jgi:hypothetical protein
MNKYRIVKKINGLGAIKFYVEWRVAFFFWYESVRFDTHEETAQFIEDRMRAEAANTWVRAK